MKASKWLLVAGMAATGMLSIVYQAHAGLKQTSTVTVNKTSRYFSGAFGSARNSSDSTQQLSCSILGYTTSSPIASCYANDSAGNYAVCNTTNATLVHLVQSLTGDERIYVEYDSSNNCTFIQAIKSSQYAPKLN